MKTSLLCFAFFFVMQLNAQINYTLSEPISVTDGVTSFGKHHPRVLILDNGTALVFWSRSGTNGGIYYSIYDGESFGSIYHPNTNPISPNYWAGGLGPEIAAKGDYLYIVTEVYGDAIYCLRSIDGGLTFEPPVAAFTPPSDRAATLPSVGILNDGNPIISYINTNSQEQDARYETVISSDFGISFNAPVHASINTDGDEVCECCPGSLFVSENDDIQLSFRNNNEDLRDIWLVKSTDNGASYPSAVDIDQADWQAPVCPSSGPHMIDNGVKSLAIFYTQGSTGWDEGIYLGAADNQTYVPETTVRLPNISNSGTGANYPRLAGHGDTLAVVWSETFNSSKEIALALSVTGAAGLINETINLTAASSNQNYPDIAYKDGVFHIVYEDGITNTVVYQTLTLGTGTGLNQISGNNDILFYPNPTTGILYADIPSTFENGVISLIDISGKEIAIYSKDDMSDGIDLSNIKKGLYFIKVESKTLIQIQKIIID